MKHLKTFLIVASTAALLSSCRKDDIRGSGNIITQDRSLPAFQNVTIQGPIRANVRYGATQQVTVRTDAVAISKVWTTVNNNTLIIDVDNSHDYQHISFEVDIQLPVIHRLTHEGVSNSLLSGFQGLDALEVIHHGVGDLECHGSTGQFHIVHNGVGNLRAFDLTADTCQVAQSGVGNIEVRVMERLEGYLDGVGNLYYQGAPQVNVTDNGVGQVIHVD